MIEVIKDKDGKCIAYIEYNVVNDKGQLDNKGVWIWIQDLWSHESIRGNGVIRRFINVISKEKVPWSKYVYFTRRKYSNRIRDYKRNQIVKGE